MKFFQAVIALLLAATSLTARADLINVTARIGWAGSGAGNGGFESVGPDVEKGFISFVYDNSIQDSDPSPHFGHFQDALLSLVMTVEQVSRPTLVFNLLPVRNGISTVINLPEHNLQLRGSARDLSGIFGDLEFALGFGSNLATQNFPNQLPGVDYWNAGVFGDFSTFGHAAEWDWVYYASATVMNLPSRIPVSSTAALYLLGIIGLFVSRSRKYRYKLRFRVPGIAVQ